MVRIFALFWQINELFKGNVNVRGVIQLVLVLAALAVIISISIFIGVKAFKTKR